MRSLAWYLVGRLHVRRTVLLFCLVDDQQLRRLALQTEITLELLAHALQLTNLLLASVEDSSEGAIFLRLIHWRNA